MNLSVNILTEGIHSGEGSGVVPDSFRIIRKLLSRIEDVETGEVTLKDLQVDIPKDFLEQTRG